MRPRYKISAEARTLQFVILKAEQNFFPDQNCTTILWREINEFDKVVPFGAGVSFNSIKDAEYHIRAWNDRNSFSIHYPEGYNPEFHTIPHIFLNK